MGCTEPVRCPGTCKLSVVAHSARGARAGSRKRRGEHRDYLPETELEGEGRLRGSTNGPPKSTRAKASRSVWPSLAFCAGVLTSRRPRESEELLGYRDTTQYRGQEQTVHTVACIAANGAKCRQMSPSTIRYLSSCGAVKAGPTRWFLMFARACAREEESREPT